MPWTWVMALALVARSVMAGYLSLNMTRSADLFVFVFATLTLQTALYNVVHLSSNGGVTMDHFTSS